MDSAQAARVQIEILTPEAENLSPDITPEGIITVDEARLYHLAALKDAVEGELLITYLDAGIESFAFTFGSK